MHDAAACDTVKVCPATAPVTVRAVVLVLAATVNVSDPDPVRPVPFWNVSTLLALAALHEQPAGVETVILPLVPAAGALMPVGLMDDVHANGTVNCSGVEYGVRRPVGRTLFPLIRRRSS